MRKHLMETVILCEECIRQGRTTVGTHADHIVPKAKGGSDDRENYALLCASCHSLKSIHDQNKTHASASAAQSASTAGQSRTNDNGHRTHNEIGQKVSAIADDAIAEIMLLGGVESRDRACSLVACQAAIRIQDNEEMKRVRQFVHESIWDFDDTDDAGGRPGTL